MSFKIDYLMHQMSLTNYKKWLRLFVRYGTWAQQKTFLDGLNCTMEKARLEINEQEEKVAEFQCKLNGEVPTVLAPAYLQKQLKLEQGHLNNMNKRLDSLRKKYELLKGCLI